VIAMQPKNADLSIRLCNLLVNQNKIDDALKALDANPQDPRVGRRRIEVLLNAARLDDAEKALETILADNPSNLDLLQMASSVAIGRQKYDVAKQRLDRALEIDPKHPTTHYFIGLMMINQPK